MQRSLLISALYLLSVQGLHCEDFRGRNCVDGCPNLKAGYKWAQDNDAHDPYLCLGQGREFEQGCNAYVLEAGPAPPPPKKKDDPSSRSSDDPTSGDTGKNDEDHNVSDRDSNSQQ